MNLQVDYVQESLYTILQILSGSVFEKILIYQIFTDRNYDSTLVDLRKQLKFFEC